MKHIHVLLFYKYVRIEDPLSFKESHLDFCKDIGLRGRILVAEEGINGSVAGTEEQVEAYKSELRRDNRFADIIFKEDLSISIPFKKMIIKIKKEIVNFGQEVNLAHTGKNLTPQEFLDIYNKENEKIGKEIIILDARNKYESHVGKFKGALTPQIKTFREFPKVAQELQDKKDKKIIMYCTGGIRCEKASAYFRQQGFKDVSQLKGGILSFGKEFPDTIWEGTCFVFDKRLKSNVNSENKPITSCELCGIACDLYKNCSEFSCDTFCTICIQCEQLYGGCCSKKCFELKRETTQLQCSSPKRADDFLLHLQ
ncbi:MAG: rhodanese-related sulfurtransferase [Nanoarchaeota archaeon]